ncbi:MAG TPA: DUF4097 family beta strand repeat-containing protein [Pseudonocardia sp.]|nr:DUF4097 family beta strand repeat-containing protein [Pseudonocardia sp.]
MLRTLNRSSLIGAAVILTALALAGCGSSDEDNSGAGSPGGNADDGGTVATNDYKIADPVRQITVTGFGGDVTLSAGDGPIGVSETIRYTDDKPRTSHTVKGGVATLKADPCQHVRQVNGSCVVDWDIHAPAGTAVNLTSSSGDISVTGFAGPVFAKASAGDIEGRELTSKVVNATSNSGDVKLVFLQPPDQANAITSAGDVSIGVPPGTNYAVDAHSSTDRPNVAVPNAPNSPHKLKASTSSGAVDVTIGDN